MVTLNISKARDELYKLASSCIKYNDVVNINTKDGNVIMISEEDYDFGHNDWREHEYFKSNKATADYDVVTKNIDEFLKKHGYTHDGTRFLCNTDKREKVAIFCHGGSGACVLAHVLALPFPYTLTVLPYDYTSIIELSFPVVKGEYIHPRIELFNDVNHTKNLSSGLKLQQKSE